MTENKLLILTLLVTTALSTGYAMAASSGNCGREHWDESIGTWYEDTCTYTIDNDGVMTISGTGKFYGRDMDWEWLNGVTSIVVNEGITTLGFDAFQGATNVTSVSLPNGLTTIESQAFSGMTGLRSIDIPNTVTKIENGAFNGGSLESIVIPNGITEIYSDTFYSQESLKSVTIPDSVTKIGNDAFMQNRNLESIDIPDSVTSIGNEAFMQTSLSEIIIPDSVTSIGNRAFKYSTCTNSYISSYTCKSPTSIVIGDSVTSIGSEAFGGVIGTVFCPSESICSGSVLNNFSGTIQTYTKDENGVYQVGDTYYASPEDMGHVENGVLSPISCTSYDSCKTAAAAYKNAKAASMAGGSLCATQQECLNLMNMVSDSDYTCTTIAACSAYAKDPQNNITLASLYPQSGGTGGNEVQPQKPARKSMLIYTIDEANAVAGKVNRVSIRYR